jgi:outer membrane protein assembly factor BamB
MLAHAPASWAASTLRGFPVRLEGSVEVGGPLAFDIDGDGRLELVVPAGNGLHALEVDGNSLEGFPIQTKKGNGIVTPLTVGFLGTDRTKAVILFGTEDKKLMAYNGTGKLLEGFPVVLDEVMAGAPVLGDVDGDNHVEIVFGTKGGKIYALDAGGKSLPGYPAKAGAPVSTAVTIGRFRPGEATLLIFGDQKGKLHAWRAPGKQLKGFPYKALYTVASQPVLGDIDDDGSFEVVFGSKDFKIYAVKETGKVASGFPVGTGYRIYSSCALADVDGDGITDVVATSGDGNVYAVSKGGKNLQGFPVKVGRRLRASPVIGDVDCDGRMEIAVGTDGGRLALLRDNGQMYPGFPARMADRIDVAPMLSDINGDGLVEISAVSRDGTLSVFKVIKKGKFPPNLVWPAEGRNPDRRGITWPNPPRYLDLALAPETPRSTEELSLSYRFFDLDGDAEPQTRIRWYRNSKPVPELDGVRKVPASATRKRQRWHYTLQADEHGRVFKSPEVRVGNTPPGAARVAILPDPPRTGDDMTMKVVAESQDADDDKIQYTITWLKDRVPVKGLRRPKVLAKATASGQRWTVVVVPSDGEVNGAPARATIQVANTPPSAPKVRLEPAQPTVTQKVRAVVERPGRDPDGEKVKYRYRWEVAGQPLNLPADAAVLPAGFARKGNKIAVEVTSFDGKVNGGSTRAESGVVNSPASAPAVKIMPSRPRTGDDLSVEIVKPAADPDSDVLKYEFLWRREPQPYAGPHARSRSLPAKETKKGEKWSVGVTPTDGDDRGKLATAEATVVNSPPSAPEITAQNPRPTTAEDLVLRVVKSPVDPDGDEVSVDVVWYQGKKQVARGTSLWQLAAAKTRKGKKYRAAATPSDGLIAGPTVDQWFEVQNTPPTKCAVTLPYKPHTGDDLPVRLTEKPTDPDGDPVKMRFQWYLNGEPVKSGPKPQQMEGKRVARGQRWTVVATPSDGEAAGPACEASALVGNSPPSAARIVLKPQKPSTGEGLVVNIVGKPTDADGDEVGLSYSWTIDGKPFPAGGATTSIPAGILKKGQKWKVTVAASDGELKSKPATAEVTVINSPPQAPRVAIRPTAPLSSDDLNCRLVKPTPDADGDTLKHTFEWFKVKGKKAKPAGKAQSRGSKLPAKLTKKGQNWVCRVRAHDGKAPGEYSLARVQVANAAPAAPKVEIRPADPATDSKLECIITGPAKDPDGDKVKYRFVWTKDGVAQAFAPVTDRVPGRLTREKDIWQCTVTATDGRLSSPPAYSQEVIVRPK